MKAVDSILVSGLKRLTGGKKAVINFNREMLLNKLPLIFPSNLLGVEINEDADRDKKVNRVVKKLKEEGYLLIINDQLFNNGDISLVKMADIVSVDFRSGGLTKRFSIFEDDPHRPRFLARSVETASDFDIAVNNGYKYFQGNFFKSLDLVSLRSIPGYKMNLMRILKEINKPEVKFERIEEIIKKDVSITYKLLRFINSSTFGNKTTVQSIRHALNLLGEEEVKKWLSLIVMSSVGEDKPQELAQGTLVRAKLCESIAGKLNLKDEMSNYFLVGMLSMVDAFLGRPMEEILADLPLDTEVKNALMGESNRYRDVLELVCAYEKGEWRCLEKKSESMKLDQQSISTLYLEAVEWGKLL
jgi:EAL and modified HD-GYP domain-containing signal transduction protein